MVYSSLLFIYGFLPLSLLIYYVFPKKYRSAVLLAESVVFCGMISLWYLAFMMIYVIINYASCRLTEKQKNSDKHGILPFVGGVAFDTASIFIFRFHMFENLRDKLGSAADFFPIGISFFTLSAIGVLTDVFRGRIKAEKSIVNFALYIMMFPKLIMGPVISYPKFIRASEKRSEGLSAIGEGLIEFIKGLAKKILFADSLYMLWSAVSNTAAGELSVLTAWLGAAAYILCLYFTLSSFSDMCVGILLCFGYRYPKSFNYPMFSSRIRTFYSRWLIQVFKSFRKSYHLAASPFRKDSLCRKLIYVFFWASLGFWYTFNLNGFVWGLLIGTAVLIEKRFSNAKMLDMTGIIYTFFAVVLSSAVLFGGDLVYSFRYIIAMLGGNGVLADSVSLYLVKSYFVLILICMYASTDLFRNVRVRIKKMKIRYVFEVITPIVMLVLMVVCTSLISYGGSSGTMLMML